MNMRNLAQLLHYLIIPLPFSFFRAIFNKVTTQSLYKFFDYKILIASLMLIFS